MISFLHEPSQNSVFFKAFITAYNETFNSDWATETVFGRTDPIHSFRQTSRRITIAFKVPAATYTEAYDNLANVQALIQYLYPNYSTAANGPAQTISQNPYIRLKVMNLGRKAEQGFAEAAKAFGEGQWNPVGNLTDAGALVQNGLMRGSYLSDADPTRGMLGVVSNLTVNHNLENPDIGVLTAGHNMVLPKLIEINMDFNVVHETRLGWSPTSDPANETGFDNMMFPYGAIAPYRMDPGYDGILDSAQLKTFDEQKREIIKEQQKKVMAEQEKANAEARYRGMFSEARFKGDQKFVSEYEKMEESLRGMEIGSKEYEKTLKKINNQSANYAYLRSATQGADQDGDGKIDSGFID